MVLIPAEKEKNEDAIAAAFMANPAINANVVKKLIAVKQAIWQWDGKDNVSVFGKGEARCSTFYATGDTRFHCSCMDDQPGGMSSEFYAAFQRFTYDKESNLLVITGDKGGKSYTVRITFG